MRRLISSILSLLMLSCTAVLAQRAYWEPNAGSLAFEQTSSLRLVFENCTPENDPKPPAAEGLDLQFTGTESSIAFENGSMTRKHLYNFSARPVRRGAVQIPGFDIETDKGPQHIAPASFTIGNASIGHTRIPLDTAAKISLKPADGEFWAGEVFPVTYTLDIARRFRPRPPGPIEWKPAPLSIEDWGQPVQFESTEGGEPRIGLHYKTRGYIATPGSYTIPAATQEVVLVVETNGGLFGFPSPELYQHTLTTNKPILNIKPLPDGAPADFGGAVGQFTLTSKVVPTTVSVGEPVTWTLELRGTGNWPDVRALPSREVSKDFKALQPLAKRTPADGKVFDAALTEDVVLIPTKPGVYTLGPVRYAYFDPGTGAYRTVQTGSATVTITPPGAAETAAQSLFLPPPALHSPPSAMTAAARLHAAPSAPAAIPRDPLPGEDSGFAPLRGLWSSLWLLASVLWLIPAWLMLAKSRARRTDPLLPRREARERLGRILDEIPAAATPAARNDALLHWQRATATLLDISHAAPTSAMLADGPRDPANKAVERLERKDWEALWIEAERALYGSGNRLPEGWLKRAGAALESTRLPEWKASSLFLPGNLFPWINGNAHGFGKRIFARLLVGIVVCSCLSAVGPRLLAEPDLPSSDSAADTAGLNRFASPRAAYDAGAFPAAEQGWRAAVARNPRDWVARHNLGLALAQQDHWPEAAAQWTSAFLLNPRNESVRWHLALGYERAEYTPPGFGEFAQASGPHLLARAASPAEWQWLLVGAGLIFSAGLFILLLRAYDTVRGRWTGPATIVAMATGVILALCAMMSLHFYGEAANPRAAIAWHQSLLRSVPTEADTQQKTSSLPAGSIGVVDKEFLGWVRMAFENGQTGWVRREDIVSLYR